MALPPEVQAQSLARELRPHKPRGLKKQKGIKKENEQTNKTPSQMVKAKPNRQKHTNTQTHKNRE